MVTRAARRNKAARTVSTPREGPCAVVGFGAAGKIGDAAVPPRAGDASPVTVNLASAPQSGADLTRAVATHSPSSPG